MKTYGLYFLWAALYGICTALGFTEDPAGMGKVLLVLSGLIFFLPGFLLLISGIRRNDRKRLLVLRILSGTSLGLTLAALIANFLSATASAAVGDGLYLLLRLVSTPMMCVQYWVVSLFLWACLFVGSLYRKK